MPEHVELITVMFAAILAFTLLIERALEVLKAVFDLIDSYYNLDKFWTKRTYAVQRYMEKQLRVFEYVDPKRAIGVFNRFHELLLGPTAGYNGTVPMLCGDLVRAVWVKIGLKVVGAAAGLVIAFWLNFDLLAAARGEPVGSDGSPAGLIITGLAMGLGTGPMHKLIRVVEKKRDARAPDARLPQGVTNA